MKQPTIDLFLVFNPFLQLCRWSMTKQFALFPIQIEISGFQVSTSFFATAS